MMTSTTGPSAKGHAPRCAQLERVAGVAGRREPAAGFTLLELVLVMVIICTVLAMAAPSLRGFFASRQTSDAAAKIVALAEFARSQAAAEGRTYHLNLDTENGKYWLTAQEGGSFTMLSSEFGRTFLLPEGTSARWEAPAEAGSRGWIPFYPDGRTEAAAISLTGRQSENVRVVCLSPAEQFQVVVPAAGGGL